MDQHAQLSSDILNLRRQAEFAWDVWRYGKDGAVAVFQAVAVSASALRQAINSCEDDTLRDELSEMIRPTLSTLAYMHEQGFTPGSSGPVHPSKFFGKVRSVKPAGPPGSGKRR